jgi:hypothetical protein
VQRITRRRDKSGPGTLLVKCKHDLDDSRPWWGPMADNSLGVASCSLINCCVCVLREGLKNGFEGARCDWLRALVEQILQMRTRLWIKLIIYGGISDMLNAHKLSTCLRYSEEQ